MKNSRGTQVEQHWS